MTHHETFSVAKPVQLADTNTRAIVHARVVVSRKSSQIGLIFLAGGSFQEHVLWSYLLPQNIETNCPRDMQAVP